MLLLILNCFINFARQKSVTDATAGVFVCIFAKFELSLRVKSPQRRNS